MLVYVNTCSIVEKKNEMKRFIVLELITPDFPVITTDEDGAPEIFEDENSAHIYAAECQDGFVVELPE